MVLVLRSSAAAKLVEVLANEAPRFDAGGGTGVAVEGGVSDAGGGTGVAVEGGVSDAGACGVPLSPITVDARFDCWDIIIENCAETLVPALTKCGAVAYPPL